MPTAEPKSSLVRLKPYDARRRNVMRKFTHVPTGARFEEHLGWYKVEAELAGYLRTVRQIRTDDTSPLAFDVCTKEQAAEIDKKERRAKMRADSDDPNDYTGEDIRREEAARPAGRRTAGEAVEPPRGVTTPEPEVSMKSTRASERVDPFERASQKGVETSGEKEPSTDDGAADPFEGVVDEAPPPAAAKAASSKPKAKRNGSASATR